MSVGSLMGSSGGLAGVLVPRAHVDALLGGGHVFEMSARELGRPGRVLVAHAALAVCLGRR